MPITLITLVDGTIPVANDFNTNFQALRASAESGIASGTAYAVRGLLGNPGASPTTQYAVSADQVQLWNPSTGERVTRTTVSAITVDVSTAGPIANGRDQAGAFTASSWVHLYFIWNGTTLATIASATAPATGPMFPTGYTHWAYIGAVRFNASSQLVASRIRGSDVTTDGTQTALSGGTATTETAVSLSSFIPPNALMVFVSGTADVITNGSGVGQVQSVLRVVSGINAFAPVAAWNATASAFQSYSWGIVALPNVSQQLFYLNVVAFGTSPHTSILVHGYIVPNGGE